MKHWIEYKLDDDELDAPWSTASLERRRTALQAMDVCGGMDDCSAGLCPCALLKGDPRGLRSD